MTLADAEISIRSLLGFPERNIVMVTGGRDFGTLVLDEDGGAGGYDRAVDEMRKFRKVMDDFHRERPITEIRHGAMSGADALASRWAYENSVDTNPYGALWGSLGRAVAGPFRNRIMCTGRPGDEEPRPDWCIAFPGGRGTAVTIALAQKYGIEVIEAERLW